MAEASSQRTSLHARVWRWHFFAGLWVAPFGILLALSGSVYLFNPQIDAWLQRRVDAPLVRGASLPADDLAAAAIAHVPGGALRKLVLPAEVDASIRFSVSVGDGAGQLVWVERTSGRVVQSMAADSHPMQLAKKFHGELLAGRFGSAFVELAACWMIVLLLSGAYLAWPRYKSLREVLLPGLDVRSRRGLRALHAAGGLWVGGLVLIFLVSGLPWTGVWGEGFRRVRALAAAEPPEDHSHHAMHGPQREAVSLRLGAAAARDLWTLSSHDEPRDEVAWISRQPVFGAIEGETPLTLQRVLELAEREHLPPPVEISPSRDVTGAWTVQSLVQRRPDRVTLTYDGVTGQVLSRTTFADASRLDQAVSIGIAFHEGQLFGPLNQALGVLIAVGVIGLCASGLAMWWRRKPIGRLGVPPLPANARLSWGITAVIVSLAVLLPLVGVSLLVVLALELVWERIGLRTASRVASRAS